MGRYIEATCRLCRRHGDKLFLKATKCQTDKCPVAKRPFPPGQHGKMHKKETDYGRQVAEKQKVKIIYGILEKQFRRYFRTASKSKGITGEVLLQMLERRLDNVIFKLSFALSRTQARQMVMHGLVLVNSKNVNIPSYTVKVGDKIEIKPKERIQKRVKDSIEIGAGRQIPSWIKKEKEGYKAEIISLPKRDDVGFPVNENLIVELYSK